MKEKLVFLEDSVEFRVPKELYSKDVVVQASYVLLDQYYFFLDAEENYFIVTLSLKEEAEENLQQALVGGVKQFLDELLEAKSYLSQLEKTSRVREIILEKALLTQTLDEELIEEFNSEMSTFK